MDGTSEGCETFPWQPGCLWGVEDRSERVGGEGEVMNVAQNVGLEGCYLRVFPLKLWSNECVLHFERFLTQ